MYGYIIPSIIAYIIGNFSTSYLIGKYTANIDIRQHGSGNAGTTNMLRILGKKAAMYTFIGDGVKGIIAVLIGLKLGGINVALVSGVFVVIGHIWPIVLKFKGGKGVATAFASMLVLFPLQCFVCAVLVVLAIYKTRYVSFGSILGVCIFPLFMISKGSIALSVALSLMALILFTHKQNVKRLINGTESKIGKKTVI